MSTRDMVADDFTTITDACGYAGITFEIVSRYLNIFTVVMELTLSPSCISYKSKKIFLITTTRTTTTIIINNFQINHFLKEGFVSQ